MSVTLAHLNSVNRVEFTAALGPLFEHSPWVAQRTHAKRPFRGAAHLHAELCATMRSAPEADRLALLCAHPDLAGRLARLGQLTAESTSEQRGAGLDSLGEAGLAEFKALNDAYKSRFGFPFIICARLNDRASILAAMKSRVSNDPSRESEAALAEIEKIAWLRLKDILTQKWPRITRMDTDDQITTVT